MHKPILSIAIPTWNRSSCLQISLTRLLPQIGSFENEIELIISDNASNDDTLVLLNRFKHLYPSLNFQILTSKENYGFFGNFLKCIQEAKGSYFWLLSDDDYIASGLLNTIVPALKSQNVGAIFFKEWSSNKSIKSKNFIKYVNRDDFFNDEPYRHSLISSVIHRNKYFEQKESLLSLSGNSLVGYAYFMLSISNEESFIELYGDSIFVRNDVSERFNGFEIFTNDLFQIVNMLKDKFNNRNLRLIVNSFIKTNIKYYFKIYKYSRQKRYYNLSNLLLFYRYKNFYFHLLPFMLCPRNAFFMYRKLRKLPKYYEF